VPAAGFFSSQSFNIIKKWAVFLFCNDTIYLLNNGYFLSVRRMCSGTAKKMPLIAANNYFCAEIKSPVESLNQDL
jgi:hypothetical protein